MESTNKMDLRGKPCNEFIFILSRSLLAMKPGESIEVIADQDRISCMHMILKNAPRYLYKGEVVGDHAEIRIRKLR